MSDVRIDPDNALTCDGGSRAEINNPTEPEPVGPLAAKYLDHLAAQQADEDLAARRRDILDRLRHQKPAHRRSQQP